MDLRVTTSKRAAELLTQPKFGNRERECFAMLCPVCKTTLLMSERSGIEIDYCPSCRGIWLDRGELEKLIERSAVAPTRTQPEPPRHPQPNDDDSDYDRRSPPGHPPRYKKRESWLGELFDFD